MHATSMRQYWTNQNRCNLSNITKHVILLVYCSTVYNIQHKYMDVHYIFIIINCLIKCWYNFLGQKYEWAGQISINVLTCIPITQGGRCGVKCPPIFFLLKNSSGYRFEDGQMKKWGQDRVGERVICILRIGWTNPPTFFNLTLS